MSIKLLETNLPNTLKAHVTHLHSGNSSKRQRHGKAYRTIAKLIDIKTQNIVSVGEALCNEHDVPSRKLGRQIAVGRAFKDYLEVLSKEDIAI